MSTLQARAGFDYCHKIRPLSNPSTLQARTVFDHYHYQKNRQQARGRIRPLPLPKHSTTIKPVHTTGSGPDSTTTTTTKFDNYQTRPHYRPGVGFDHYHYHKIRQLSNPSTLQARGRIRSLPLPQNSTTIKPVHTTDLWPGSHNHLQSP